MSPRWLKHEKGVLMRPKFRYYVDQVCAGPLRRYRVQVLRRTPSGSWQPLGTRHTLTRRGGHRWAERQMRRSS